MAKMPKTPRTDDEAIKQLQELRAAGPVTAAATSPGERVRPSDGEVARAVMALEIALSSPSFQAVLGGKSAAAADAPGSSFCEIYGEIKDYIDIALEALDWLPVPYAATIAKVIRLLEKFADRACRS